jgi:cell division protein FtsZ
MNEMGMALMGTGKARGENRAVVAAQAAISNPLLEELSIQGARGVLINITGGADMTLHEVHEAASLVREQAHEDANIIFGSVVHEAAADEVRVTVIATGLEDRDRLRRQRPEPIAMGNVTPLRPPVREEAPGPLAADPPVSAQAAGTDFLSPFEEELDVPAFIRRGHKDGY